MKRIVTIERQRRSRNRYTLHFDDGEWLGLFDELIIRHGLKEGIEVDSEKLTQLAREDDAKKALEMAIRYLGYRSRSQKEMITYLEGKGFDRDLIDETMEKLEGYGYIDDSAFARDWVAGRMSSKPMGRAMIKRELIFKGVEDEVIEEHLGRISQDQEEDRAYSLALKYVKRYKNLEPREQFHKIGAALARRGFDWETIKGAVRRLSIGDLDE